jgi:hypothetical protein
MTRGLWLRWVNGVFLTGALLAAASFLTAGERPQAAGSASGSAEVIEFFAGIEKGQIEVQFIPKDSSQATVLVKNKTDKPLSIKLPETFAGVPVLAQLGAGGLGGMDGGRGGRRGGLGGTGGMGGGQMMGGGMGMGGMGMGGMGGMGGFGGQGMFNVAPEKVGQIKVTTVCLEHGKPEPRPSMKYQIKPIDQATDKLAVHEICASLGRGELNQRVAQIAAWHLNCGMSWDELARKQYKYATGMTRPYFTREEIQAAMQAVSAANLAAEKSKSAAPSQSSSVSQNAPK